MITYRDMTFCTGEGCQSFSRCLRAFTPEIAQAARNSGRPVSLMRPSPEMDCYIPDQPESRPEEVVVS
jgi:hypothetical protein